MHAGKPVSVNHLVDAIWDGDPPKSYLSNLHTYVSRLRERLPGLRIDHVDGQRNVCAGEPVAHRNCAAPGRSSFRGNVGVNDARGVGVA
ncbi:hypothetical protein A6A25_04545 [Saccharothrix sp. CB00851]|nr:hypothetical protein A6A25_04545 [Saccharothrix sp. CB00851]